MTEIPMGAPGVAEAPGGRERPEPDRLDLETLRWLSREPAGPRSRGVDRQLQRAIRGAIEGGSLAPLVALGERQRREILETVERRIGRRHAPGVPQVSSRHLAGR